MKTKSKKLTSIFLAFVMILSLFITVPVNAVEISDEDFIVSQTELRKSNYFMFTNKIGDNISVTELTAGNTYYAGVYIDLELALGANFTVTFTNDSDDNFSYEALGTRELVYSNLSKMFLYLPCEIPDDKYGDYEVTIDCVLANGQHCYNDVVIDIGISQSGQCGDNLTWLLDSDGLMTISGTGEMWDFYPLDYDTVVPWKSYRKYTRNLVVNEGVTSIGEWAFYGSGGGVTDSTRHDTLLSVDLPNSLTKIGNYAFSYCDLITEIVIPDAVVSIGQGAFNCCKLLRTVNLPKQLTEIDKQAFYYCTSLESITIPNEVTSIGNEAFYHCTSLTSIEIPNSVTYIGYEAFDYCTNLKSAVIKGDVTLNFNGRVFNYNTSLESVCFEGKITIDGSLSNDCFGECTSLTTVTVPSEILTENGESISYSYFFDDSKSITDISFNDGKNQLIDGVVYNKDKTKLIWSLPSNNIIEYSILDGCTSIGSSAFSYNSNLEHVIIPDSVTEIGSGAFSYCPKLNNVIIPDGVTTLSNTFFIMSSAEKALSTVVIPASVTDMTPYNYKNTSGVFYGIENVTIYADKDSYAEEYANTYSFYNYAETVYCNFDANGGSVNKTKIPVIPNDKYWTLPTPTRAGYKFDGWYTAKTGGTKVTEDTVVTESTSYTLYAHWTANSTVTPLSNCTVTLSTTSYTYDGTAKKPAVTVKDSSTTLTNGTDYTVSYSNNTNAGTATVTVTGKGNYTGSVIKTFTISQKSVNTATVTLSATSYTYDGTARKPDVTVKNGSATLTSGTDYTVTYSNNTNVGTATVTITGKGNYTDSIFDYFTINAKSISSATVTLGTNSYTYDGKEKQPSVTVKDGTKTLINGTHYTVSYSNNINVGTATVKVTGKGNYTGTVSKTFTITQAESKFVWGEDNWNFNNSKSTYFSNSKYRNQISDKYLNILKNNLTNSEYQVIFKGTWYSDAWLDESWGGSCYGMSSTAFLSMEGLLPYSNYKTGASSLYELNYPITDLNVSSLVTYYQMLQVKDVIQQQYRSVPNKTNEENIKNIISLLDEKSTVLVGFKKNGWGGHAILAYDYEYGSYTWNNVNYQGCIKICDPNSSKKYNESCNIYFNTKTYNWTIPAYSGITSSSGAVFNYVGANVDEINEGGYLSDSSKNNNSNYIARIDAAEISENRTVTKVKETNGNYITQSYAPGDIIEDYSYILGSESKGTIGYNLFDSDSSYKISQSNPVELQLSIDYENCYLLGGSYAGKSIIFDKKGYVYVEGEAADYNISMTFNENYATDWFTIQVTGSNADMASLKMVDDGYIISADNLENVVVSANNRDDSVSASFSTDYSSVYIYETKQKSIGLKVDTDNNGTYETELKSDSGNVVIGDVNGDSNVSIDDVTLIQKYIANMYDFDSTQLKAADVTGDGDINIDDVTKIQKYIAGLISSLSNA